MTLVIESTDQGTSQMAADLSKLNNYSTAKSWVRKYEKDPTRLPDVGRSGGRSECQLDEEDMKLVRQFVAECPEKETSNTEFSENNGKISLDWSTPKFLLFPQW